MLLLAFSWTSCEFESSSGTNGQSNGNVPDTSVVVEEDLPEPPVRPSCELIGSVLPENQFWAKSENLIVTIAADEETKDPDMGESHRILLVYDENCEIVFKNVLPVNLSPDYPYYLSEITYNNISGIIAIRGFDDLYIFDLKNKQLSEPLNPRYLTQRFVDDAQSGLIQRLEVWEDYLIGYATSMGAFVFDLSDPMNAEAVLPSAEYEIMEGTQYNSLFFLKSVNGENGHQAILPSFDLNTGDFEVNPMFDKPINLETNINKSVRNNRYLVLRELLGGNDSRPIGVDMKEMIKHEVPDNIAQKKTTEIVDWIKSQ